MTSAGKMTAMRPVRIRTMPPADVKPDIFAGPLLATGQSYNFTFNETGVVSYHYAPHPGMRGSITVVNGEK